MKNTAGAVALGGVMAALAVVIMTFGGMIPIATYVCPMLCMFLLFAVNRLCGSRIGWAWYAAVTLLCLLLSPDKEAAAVFMALGYYPIIKPKIDRKPCKWLWKFLLFNAVTLVLYALLLYVVGMEQLLQEFTELGTAGLIVTLLLGNVCFFLTDRVLEILPKKFKKK